MAQSNHQQSQHPLPGDDPQSSSAKASEVVEMQQDSQQQEHEQEWGVLLYYKFVPIANPSRVVSFFHLLCSSLSLHGRLRIAVDGINVTVGGRLSNLHLHISAVRAHPLFAFPPIDFKLSLAPPFHKVPSLVASDTGFSSLSVRTVDHLITLGLHPSLPSPDVANAGRHVTPHEFHDQLNSSGSGPPNCVLIDARNIYETRIGRFQPPPGVQCFDPLLRQYSDLPRWLDDHQGHLRNKRVLMYCTGGVRCELASSYLRGKGKGFEDVLQLSGGIHRYLEAFADGGYFKGKNFVFDHRLSVASSSSDEVVGHCLLCRAPFDDYSARNRCSLCRLLVLICTECQVAAQRASFALQYVCELCETNQKMSGQSQQGAVCERNSTPIKEHGTLAMASCPQKGLLLKQKLRILCLHGFRQNASSFKGRLASLNKKLRHIAEFVFVDAPHLLPFVHQGQHEDDATASLSNVRSRSGSRKTSSQGPTRKYAWMVSPSDTYHTPELDTLSDANQLEPTSSSEVEKIKSVSSRPAHALFDPLQYQTQTEGWERSLEYLQEVFQDLGPFDGILGFSQGAAVAAALCPLRRSGQTNRNVHFKFVVLCSGYILPVPFFEKKVVTGSRVSCPSLHIFGGQDRQIDDNTSKQLSSLFESKGRIIVKHGCGHIIPTKLEYIEQYMQFLNGFLE